MRRRVLSVFHRILPSGETLHDTQHVQWFNTEEELVEKKYRWAILTIEQRVGHGQGFRVR